MKRTVKALISAVFITALVSMMMLMGSLTANAWVIAGTNFWSLTDDGVLTTWAYGESACDEWKQERNLVKKVIFEDGTRYICSGAFDSFPNLESVIIPDSIEYIGDNAFRNNPRLKSITIPGNVVSVGDNAFESCEALEEVIIESGAQSFGEEVFSGCTSLKSITFPDSVTEIGSGCFSMCSSLENPVLPSNLEKIEDNMFAACTSLKEFNIPSSVRQIGEGAFFGTGLKEIVLPDTVVRIKASAFENCLSLKKITIPKGVVSIGNNAFKSCFILRDVTIPEDIQTIGDSAFESCFAISKINIPDGVTSIRKNAFASCSSLCEVTISDGVTSIADGAFESCGNLSKINIPDSITSIGKNAFASCSSLREITIPRSVTEIGENAFGECLYLDMYGYKNSRAQKHAAGYDDYTVIFHCIPGFPGDRFAGEGRVDTAIEISKNGWESSDTAIIAYGMNYADALAAAPLAAGLDCPILLTQNFASGLESTILSEISRLGAKKVYLIGGKYVISESIETSLRNRLGSSNVIRLAGIGRYETSIEIAKELLKIKDQKGFDGFRNVYFCSAGSFADALAISPVAGIELNPILYAPASGSLKQANAAMYDFVKQLGVEKAFIIGGIYAVSKDAESDIAAITRNAPERVDAGITGGRYETMLNVCIRFKDHFSSRAMCVATGANFPDALAGAAFAAKNELPIILVGYSDAKNTQSSISSELKSFINEMYPQKFFVFGGEYVVPSSQVEELFA